MLATPAAVFLTAENRQHQFESALASRDVLGQAKGIVMERFEIDAVRAFELLTRMSQNANTPVRGIAEEVISDSGRRARKSRIPLDSPPKLVRPRHHSRTPTADHRRGARL